MEALKRHSERAMVRKLFFGTKILIASRFVMSKKIICATHLLNTPSLTFFCSHSAKVYTEALGHLFRRVQNAFHLRKKIKNNFFILLVFLCFSPDHWVHQFFSNLSAFCSKMQVYKLCHRIWTKIIAKHHT